MNNIITKELEKKIKDFDIRLLTDIKKFILENIDNQISILFEFNYINYKEAKKSYVICIKFESCKFNSEVGVDLNNILNINKLIFRDISANCWENINWLVTDFDDDNTPLFAFYCKDIGILSVT